jgi:transcriptional antiterminator
MKKQELTKQEEYLINEVLRYPNISQKDLAGQCLTSKRDIRLKVNSIRKKGWITKYTTPLWLVGDNSGYSLESKDSPRLEQWAKRFGNQAQDMNTILEVFNRTDLFTQID